MVAITKFLWLALAATTATAATIVQRDVITVQRDIRDKIGPNITALNTAVNAFPKSGAKGAVTIRTGLADLTATLQDTTSEIKSTGSFGVVSGTTILANIQLIVPRFLATFTAIGAQASDWDTVPGGKALILGKLKSTSTALANFLDAVTAAEPLLQKAGAVAIKTQLTGAFATAISAYST